MLFVLVTSWQKRNNFNITPIKIIKNTLRLYFYKKLSNINNMKKFAVYQQIVTKFTEYLLFVDFVEATDRNDACSKMRDGEFTDKFLTARLAA